MIGDNDCDGGMDTTGSCDGDGMDGIGVCGMIIGGCGGCDDDGMEVIGVCGMISGGCDDDGMEVIGG